jgi:hypothetical protein
MIEYINKIEDLHKKMARECNILAQSGQDAVPTSGGVISNLKKLINERDNLRLEAIKIYQGKLPSDLTKKFDESERKTDQAKGILMKAGANW